MFTRVRAREALLQTSNALTEPTLLQSQKYAYYRDLFSGERLFSNFSNNRRGRILLSRCAELATDAWANRMELEFWLQSGRGNALANLAGARRVLGMYAAVSLLDRLIHYEDGQQSTPSFPSLQRVSRDIYDIDLRQLPAYGVAAVHLSEAFYRTAFTGRHIGPHQRSAWYRTPDNTLYVHIEGTFTHYDRDTGRPMRAVAAYSYLSSEAVKASTEPAAAVIAPRPDAGTDTVLYTTS